MIKKLFISLLVIFPVFSTASYVFTCLCASPLSSIYNSVDSFIIDENLEIFNSNLDSVESSLDKNIVTVENDIKIVEDINKTLKLEIAQLTEYKINLGKSKDLIFKRE